MKQVGHGKSNGAWLLLVLALVELPWCGCKKAIPELSAVPKSFVTPESAGKALYLAAKAGDTNAMVGIFGPQQQDYLTTGEADEDRLAYEEFAADYAQMHRWSKAENGDLVLNVGVENYPFPFPLVKNADGQWAFSTEGAQKEILARQIGKNELDALDVLNAIAEGQAEYFRAVHDGNKEKQYAQRLISREGKQDGLYWTVAAGEAESPLGPLVAQASAEGDKAQRPFRGYFYRILTRQGAHAQGGARNYVVNGSMTRGFAILAYPAEYRKSGVMTFLMNQNRLVYQKDLGPDTMNTAKAMDVYDADESWTIVQ